VQAIGRNSAGSDAVQGDLDKGQSNVSLLLREAKERFWSHDIAINTVGKVFASQSWKTSEDEFDAMFESMQRGTAYFYQKKRAKHLPRQWKNHLAVTVFFLAPLPMFTPPIAGGKGPRWSHFTRPAAKGTSHSVAFSVDSIDQARWIHRFSMVQENT